MLPLKSLRGLRLPKFRSSTKTEQILWDRLDRCGLDFRQPMIELIERYGSKPAIWSEQLEICTLESKLDFIPGLAHPPAFQFGPETDLLKPPNALFCVVQASPDHRINYAKAIAALRPLFGEGTVGKASNTASRDWQFGHATLSCTVWPPQSQAPGRNRRHEVFPETKTEASIWISPAYRTNLPQRFIEDCKTARVLPAPAAPPKRLIAVGALTYNWPSALPEFETGLYLSANEQTLIKRITPTLIDILPRPWIRAVCLARITGGRGGQEAILTLKYSPSGQVERAARTMTLCDMYGDPHALDAFANEVSARLNLPVEIIEGPQD